MKLKGLTVQPPKPIPIAIPRPEGDIILHAQAVMDMTEFDSLVPEPKPPKTFTPGKGYKESRDSTEYRQAIEKWGSQRSDYLIIKTLTDGTPELEWDTVSLSDPSTWNGYQDELKSSFSIGEVQTIISACLIANMPGEERQAEALERFMLPPPAGVAEHTFRKDELDSTTSGEPVSD